MKSAKLNKLPHAFLFYGQGGADKKEFAVNFTQKLINSDITKGTHPDFILLESDKQEIGIEQIRTLIQKLSFKPYSADYKIAVVNRAHLMTKEAQNCFLKFLEEPNDKTLLILITDYPFMLLSTILSRVQKLRFFGAKNQIADDFQKVSSELTKISQSDLAFRFEYAKRISDEGTGEILGAWLEFFRKCLLDKIRFGRSDLEFYPIPKISGIIKQIQTTQFLLTTTNINRRLALEILLMRL